MKPQPSDTVPAMLTPGEHVMNTEAVQIMGRDVLNKANKAGLKLRNLKAQGFSMGGAVMPSTPISGNMINSMRGDSTVRADFPRTPEPAKEADAGLGELGTAGFDSDPIKLGYANGGKVPALKLNTLKKKAMLMAAK